MVTLPKLVSPDDHIQAPAHVWRDRLPAKWRDLGPTVKRLEGAAVIGPGYIGFEERAGGRLADVWHYEDLQIPIVRIAAASGAPRTEIDGRPVTYEEIEPGCYDQKARLAAMDAAGVEASVCYPNMEVRFCGQTFSLAKDKELALLCIKAYNDFIHEEWVTGSGGRLVGMGIVPLWDAQLAAAEAHRLAGLGFRSITFSEGPHLLGFPSIFSGFYDPLFAECEASELVLSLHIGTGAFAMLAPDMAGAVPNVVASFNSGYTLTDWLFSGLLQKYPRLKIVLAESQLAWVPYILSRADYVWGEMRGEGFTNIAADTMPHPPSYYFQQNIWLTFFRDPVGLTLLDHIGVDKVMYEVDFPHTDSSWPNSYDTAVEMTAGLADADRAKVMAETARALFRIDTVRDAAA
jgi:predicted TIM-barrel fold metal-dependent hydrolase